MIILIICLFYIIDNATTPRIFAAPDSHLKWLKLYWKPSHPFPIGLDMTYKIGHFYVTTLSMKMPLFRYKDIDRNPAITVGLAVTSGKSEEDYTYLAQSIKTHGKVNALVYGTDGEPALEAAMESTFPITGKILLNCRICMIIIYIL